MGSRFDELRSAFADQPADLCPEGVLGPTCSCLESERSADVGRRGPARLVVTDADLSDVKLEPGRLICLSGPTHPTKWP